MILIQIILIIFFIFAIIKVIGRFRVGDLRVSEMVLWIIFWLVAGIIVISPDSTFYFARLVGVSRGADLVVYVALVLLFFIVFKLIVKIEKIDRDITKIIRKSALNDKD